MVVLAQAYDALISLRGLYGVHPRRCSRSRIGRRPIRLRRTPV